MPPRNIQDRIASILGDIDDRIENNKKINDNLLQQLQAIYQRMFSQPSPGDMLEGRLSDICAYSQRRVSVASLSPDSYYSTENMLPGKAGAVPASSLPTIAQTTGCMPGDILISNIRPYVSLSAVALRMFSALFPKPTICPYICSVLYTTITSSIIWWRVPREQRCLEVISSRSWLILSSCHQQPNSWNSMLLHARCSVRLKTELRRTNDWHHCAILYCQG